MKLKEINIFKYGIIAAILVMLAFAGCDEKITPGLPPTADLETLIAEAENLVANSTEGTSPGDFQPGSVQKLQDVLTWVQWQIDNALEQKEIDDAVIRLYNSIEKFKVSTVQLAIPIFNETSGSYIQISDKANTLFANPFTVEIEAYHVKENGWLQNLIANEGDNDGSPFGFVLRFAGNALQLVIGNNTWTWAAADGGSKVGEWVHYAITYDGTVAKAYMDGVEVISFDAPGLAASNSPLCIGNGAFWSDRPYNGLARDFRIWSSIKTGDELIASKDARLDGTEENLEVYFPMDADLGSEFKDNTGNYTAKFVGEGVVWAPDGIPPVIELVFTDLDAAIAAATALKDEVVEGTNDGDYPVGTKDYLQALIDDAVALKETAEKQDQIDSKTDGINDKLDMVKDMLVADAMGVYVDRENKSAVGLRITPNYTPQGDYTVEFDLKIKTLFMEEGDNGEIFGNGSFGLRVFGYNEISEEAIANAGRLWNFTNANNAWEGPWAPGLSVKSKVWQHVAIVHDDAAKTTAIFVDGVEVGKSENLGAPLNSGWGEIWLGNSWGGKMNGTIKDFRIWDEVKAAAELDAEIDGSEANLRIYFPLDKVAGLSFKDVTGNFNAEMRGIEWEK